MAMSPRLRSLARGALATTAVLCFIFTSVSIFCTLAAGTLQMDGDGPDGPANLLLSSLSVVRFQGMVVHPTPDDTLPLSYEVTLHWFLNAFGWEWRFTTWERSCGIVHNINGILPGTALTLPRDLSETGRRLGLAEEEYWCLYSRDESYYSQGGICHGQFFNAWYEADPPSTSFGTAVPLFVYYFAVVTVITIVLTEMCVRWASPSLAKCYCPAFISNRNLCPCLKEGEVMTPSVRNRYRVCYLGMLTVTYACSFLMLLLKGIQLKAYVDAVDSKMGGMEARIGQGFIWLSCITLAAVALATVCLWVRERITPTQSWMEEQGIRGKDDVGLDRTEDRASDDAGVSL